MSNPAEPQSAQPSSPGFSVSHQKVELDLDPVARRLRGRTEITINPHSKELRTIRLNCRQCEIKRITANGRACPNFNYEEPYSKAALRWDAGVHQHQMLSRKIEAQLKGPPEEELHINLPKSVRIDDIDPLSAEATALAGLRTSIGLNSKEDSLGEASSARTAVEPERRCTPVTIYIEYNMPNIRDGIHFVGWTPDDLRYPHAYTKNFAEPGVACCLFPCVDDLAARCTWEISVKCPKTIGDAFSPPNPGQPNGNELMAGAASRATAGPANGSYQTNMSVEDKALELAVICTGDMTDEVTYEEQ